MSPALTEVVGMAKAVADLGGALVFSLYVAWELRQLRQLAAELVPHVRVIEVVR